MSYAEWVADRFDEAARTKVFGPEALGAVERDRLLIDCTRALERIAAVLEDVTDRGRINIDHSRKV